MLTSWPTLPKKKDHCTDCSNPGRDKRFFEQQHPSKRPKNTGQRDLNMRLSATRRRSDASSAKPSSTRWLLLDARVCTSTSWPTFSASQPIGGLFSASSKHWSKRKRDGGGRGRVSQVERRPATRAKLGRPKIVCARQTSHPQPREASGFPLHAGFTGQVGAVN